MNNQIITQDDFDYKGIWIPAQISERKDLNCTEKFFLSRVDLLDKGPGCWAKDPYFAEFLGISEKSVERMIGKLKNLGLLERSHFDGRNRYLKVTLEQGYMTPFRELAPPTDDGAVPPKMGEAGQNGGSSSPQNGGSTKAIDSIIYNKENNKENNNKELKLKYMDFLFPEETEAAYPKCSHPHDFERTVKRLEAEYSECPEALREALIDFSMAPKRYSLITLRRFCQNKAVEISNRDDTRSDQEEKARKRQNTIRDMKIEIQERIRQSNELNVQEREKIFPLHRLLLGAINHPNIIDDLRELFKEYADLHSEDIPESILRGFTGR